MLLSSCVVWRHLKWEDFRAECPGGDESLQRLIWERLDESLGWLESLGAEPVWRDTENPLTTGRRFDPRALTGLLLETAAGTSSSRPRCRAMSSAPLLLSTGGFPGRLAGERGLLLRANPWSEGDGLDFAVRARWRDHAGHGRVLWPRHAGSACAHRRGGLRPTRPALRRGGTRLHRGLAGDHAARGRVARERPRAARRSARVVRGRARRTTASKPRAQQARPWSVATRASPFTSRLR